MTKPLLAAIILGLGPLTFALPAWAQEDAQAQDILTQRAEDIGKVFTDEIAYDVVFTDTFIAAVPKAQFDGITSQLSNQVGPYVDVYDVVRHSDGLANVRYQFGEMLANGVIQLSETVPYKVAGFRITGVAPILAEGESIADKVAELPGSSNLLFAKLDGFEPIDAHKMDAPLAIGSAFKLWVLSALIRDIDAGNRAWSDVVTLGHPRAPSSGTQNWPDDSPVTLHTLATLMIANSDNNATDVLIDELGRETVEAELELTAHSDPSSNMPFLKTRELMLLKWRVERGELDYAALDEAGRRAALDDIRNTGFSHEMAVRLFSGAPKHIDIEWFATPRDLANVMQNLSQNAQGTAILATNPGFAPGSTDGWTYVGFKGGSEPGVLNFTWLLRNDQQEDFILTMSWNNPDAAVDEGQFMGLAQEILAAHRRAQ